MMFLYDVYLNWCDTYFVYEFYEWQDTDMIEFIKKIPIFKISKSKFLLMKNGESSINVSFLEQIQNKTILYSDKVSERIKYAAIFTDGEDAMAFEFDDDGFILLKSNIQLDEFNYITVMKLEEVEVHIVCDKVVRRDYNVSRVEHFYQQQLITQIEHLNEEKPYILEYIWQEFFDGEYNYEWLLNYAGDGFTSKHQQLLEFTELYIFHKKEL